MCPWLHAVVPVLLLVWLMCAFEFPAFLFSDVVFCSGVAGSIEGKHFMYVYPIRPVFTVCFFVLHRCARTRHQASAPVTDSHQRAGNPLFLSLRLTLCVSLSLGFIRWLLHVCLFYRTKLRLSPRKWRSFLRNTTKWYKMISFFSIKIKMTTIQYTESQKEPCNVITNFFLYSLISWGMKETEWE